MRIDRFAAAAAAPILLNLSMMAALALAAFFPTAGHAAAWGVLIAGVPRSAAASPATRRAPGVMAAFRAGRGSTRTCKRFFRALGPATVGSAGVQLALFADTIIASFLAVGALSALYYADRLNQLPIGVIGIAAGTVLLPEMARRIAGGDERGARHAQNRAIEFTLLLVDAVSSRRSCVVPELIMRALFMRGAFTAADAAAAGATLRAYALGLAAVRADPQPGRDVLRARRHRDAGEGVVHVRSPSTSLFKVACLMTTLAQVGLALATSIGAWVNLVSGRLVRASRRPASRSMRSFDVDSAARGCRRGAGRWRCGSPSTALPRLFRNGPAVAR